MSLNQVLNVWKINLTFVTLAHARQDNIDKFCRLIEHDRYFSMNEISLEMGISSGSVQSIIRKVLEFSKISDKPSTVEQKNERVRISQLLLDHFRPERKLFYTKA